MVGLETTWLCLSLIFSLIECYGTNSFNVRYITTSLIYNKQVLGKEFLEGKWKHRYHRIVIHTEEGISNQFIHLCVGFFSDNLGKYFIKTSSTQRRKIEYYTTLDDHRWTEGWTFHTRTLIPVSIFSVSVFYLSGSDLL